MNTTAAIAAAVATFTLGAIVGPATSLADEGDPNCRVVHVEDVPQWRHKLQHHRPVGQVRIVTATTVKCGDDFDTELAFGPWRNRLAGVNFR